ncbi:hypothetical protein GGQ96_001447 [Sphingomonas abaci]|uniref:Bacteriocin n=1 Tax=Sphingomonas abaci TaxID=237611 RepID=A0A7W7EX79_9SPHN|nr:hypothetical protein [Sphingomonas abaci]
MPKSLKQETVKSVHATLAHELSADQLEAVSGGTIRGSSPHQTVGGDGSSQSDNDVGVHTD